MLSGKLMYLLISHYKNRNYVDYDGSLGLYGILPFNWVMVHWDQTDGSLGPIYLAHLDSGWHIKAEAH